MKRIFTILCAALMTLSTVNAAVLFNCNFNDSTTGRLSVGSWSSGTLANDNSWYTNGSTSTYRSVIEKQLTYSGYCSTTSGKSVSNITGTQRDYILFESGKQKTSLYGGEKFYLSFLLNVKTLKGTDNAKDGFNTYIAGLLTSATGTGIAYTQGVVVVKEIDGSTFYLGVRKKNEGKTEAVYGSTVLNINQTYLVVAEYDVNEGEKNDEVKLYINPNKISPVVEVSTASGSGAANYADAGAIVGVGILEGANAPSESVIDEVRVTTAWGDFWESGGSSTPTINVSSSSVDFGTVNVGESVTKDITVSGKNLTSAISVLSSNSAVAVPSPSISIAEAEAAGGYTLTLTLTPTAAGDGTATVTLNSTDASDKVINVKWTGRKAISSIASFNLVDDYEGFALTSEPVVIRVESDYIAIQDASGALLLQNFYGSELAGIQVGDKLSGIIGLKSDADGYAETGLVTAFAVVAPQIKSSGNSADPLAVTLDNITKYGPALVKASGVSFAETGPFAAGNYTISQGSYSAKMRVPAGCDIIGQNIPESANVTGLVLNFFGNNYIQIRSKADVASGATGVDNVQSDKVQSTKVLRDGQLVIVKDGKMFNVIGVEL